MHFIIFNLFSAIHPCIVKMWGHNPCSLCVFQNMVPNLKPTHPLQSSCVWWHKLLKFQIQCVYVIIKLDFALWKTNFETTFDIFFDSLLNVSKIHIIFLLWLMDNIHERRPSWIHHVIHKQILLRVHALWFTSNQKFAPSPHNKLTMNEILSNTLRLLFDLVIQNDNVNYPKTLVFRVAICYIIFSKTHEINLGTFFDML
jgi:hypothetical protein